MKHFIWLLCGIFISGLLLGTLSACGSHMGPVHYAVITATEQTSAAPEADTVPEETEVQAEAPDEDTARRMAYGKVLWDAYLQGVLPDGTELEWLDLESAAMNDFALMDADGDGEEELVLLWCNAGVAGMTGVVYGWRDGGVYEEFREFPGLTFYESGAATADWSHNQGWAGRFWPINLYQYDPDSGVYEEIGSVDAWDREDTKGDGALDAFFPKDVDADGDGLVYYILTGDWYNNPRTPPDGDLTDPLYGIDPVDGPALEDWLNAYTNGAEPLDIPRQELTEENIAALGCPKPDGPAAEPAG